MPTALAQLFLFIDAQCLAADGTESAWLVKVLMDRWIDGQRWNFSQPLRDETHGDRGLSVLSRVASVSKSIMGHQKIPGHPYLVAGRPQVIQSDQRWVQEIQGHRADMTQ